MSTSEMGPILRTIMSTSTVAGGPEKIDFLFIFTNILRKFICSKEFGLPIDYPRAAIMTES